MTYHLIRKNKIRLIVKEYHQHLDDMLESFPNSYTMHEFSGELDAIANEIKKQHRSSDQINSIRKSLKGVRKQMLKAATESIVAGKVNRDSFMNNYYGGILLSTTHGEELYDKVIEIEPGNTVAWVFSTGLDDNVNHSQIKAEIEHDFNKRCTFVEEKYPLMATRVPTKDFETNKTPDIISPEPSVAPVPDADDGWVDNPQQIGRVNYDKKNELRLFKERKKWYFNVLIMSEFVDQIWPNARVAIYGKVKNEKSAIGGFKRITFFAELGEGEKYRAHGKQGNFDSWTSMHTAYRAYPLMQKLSSTQLTEFSNSDLTGFRVRKLTTDEILLLNGMRRGIVYGETIMDEKKTTARFPYDATNPILKTTFYQSKHFLGRMNTGKTTALIWDFMITATSPDIPEAERPIFIFLDGQQNFIRMPRVENLNDEARNFCHEHQITNPRLDVFTFSSNPTRGDTTLSLDQLPVASWIYMLAEATASTEGTLLNELDMAHETLIRKRQDITITNIRREVENRINNNTKINYNIRNAIGRVLKAPETKLFDQPNRTVLTPEMLFQPGRSLTLDVSNLNFNERRAVMSYIAEMLHHQKFVNGRKFPHVILVLDEAESLVPARGTEREKYNIERLSGRLAEITENGRQNYYGIYFVTHKTNKVNPQLVTLANTQVAFKPSADDAKFIARYFPEIELDEVLKLNTGEFWLKTFFSTEDQPEILAKCKFPALTEVN